MSKDVRSEASELLQEVEDSLSKFPSSVDLRRLQTTLRNSLSGINPDPGLTIGDLHLRYSRWCEGMAAEYATDARYFPLKTDRRC